MKKRKRKFVLQMIVVVVPTFILFNAFFYQQVCENYIQTFYEVGENITEQTSQALRHWGQYQVNIARTIARNDYIIDACRFPEDEAKIARANEFLEEVHTIYPFYENLPLSVRLEKPIKRMINGKEVEIESGEFLTDTVDGATIGECGLEYSYIREIFNGKDYYISEIYPSILRQNPILVISVPVIYESEVIAVALVSPQVDSFTTEFVDNVTFKDTGYLFFIDERNMVIAHPERESILSEESKYLEVNSEIIKKLKNGINSFSGNFFGEKKLYYAKAVDMPVENMETQWYIVFTESEEEVLRGADRYLMMSITLSVITSLAVIFLIFMFIKINQRERKKEELEMMNNELERKVEERTRDLKKMAMIDGLTQIYNYKTAYKMLKNTITSSQETGVPFVLIIADLDRFKTVNDTHGHLTGNEVLVNAARIISADVRSSDIVGRYGGEEFIIVLTNSTIEGGYKRAESIRRKIEEEIFSVEGLNVTISMGICEWNGESATELIKKADDAMYRAKNNGRNRVERG